MQPKSQLNPKAAPFIQRKARSQTNSLEQAEEVWESDEDDVWEQGIIHVPVPEHQGRNVVQEILDSPNREEPGVPVPEPHDRPGPVRSSIRCSGRQRRPPVRYPDPERLN